MERLPWSLEGGEERLFITSPVFCFPAAANETSQCHEFVYIRMLLGDDYRVSPSIYIFSNLFLLSLHF